MRANNAFRYYLLLAYFLSVSILGIDSILANASVYRGRVEVGVFLKH